MAASDRYTSGFQIFEKASGVSGIKVDIASPTFPWRDLIGQILPGTSPNAPTQNAFRTGVRAYSFSANDYFDCTFHVPHDYLPGSDIFLHTHWGHNGTAISGSLVVTYQVSYAKGHNQANFSTPISPVLTVSTPDVATVPQYRHRIDELQLSAASPSGTQLDTALLEVDGIIMVTAQVTTIPSITGGSPNNPYLFTCDIHYQSTSIGTKQKAPNFYV